MVAQDEAGAAEVKLDGKYLLRTSDPHPSAEDIALGYKQILEVERGWRDMKQILDLHPVYHRLEDRIRAHVLLCWLALLLARIVETRANTTWPRACAELQRLHVGTFTGPAGTFRQTAAPGVEARRLHDTLRVALPPKILTWTPEPEPGLTQPHGADQARPSVLVTRRVTRTTRVCPAHTPPASHFMRDPVREPRAKDLVESACKAVLGQKGPGAGDKGPNHVDVALCAVGRHPRAEAKF